MIDYVETGTSRSMPSEDTSKYRHVVLISIAIICCLALAPVYAGMFDKIWRTEQLYQNLLFPLLALYLALRQRNVLKEIEPQSSVFGWIVFAAAAGGALCAVPLFGLHSTAQYLAVLCLAALVWAVYGAKAAMVLHKSILFLVLTVPPPDRIMQNMLPNITYPERLATAWVAAKGAVLCGVPAVLQLESAQRIYVYIGNFRMAVALACSGLNYLIALIALVILYLEYFESSRKSVLILIVAAPFISLFSNIVRVLSNVLIGGWLGAGPALFYFHNVSGLVFSVLVIVLLLYTGFWLGFRRKID